MDQKYRIGNLEGGLMIAVALVFDLGQFLTTLIFLGLIISFLVITPLAWLTFYVWFKFKGVDFINLKKGGALATGFIIEMIPGLNVLPAWTAVVTILWLMIRAEDVAAQVSPALAQAVGRPGGQISTASPRAAESDDEPLDLRQTI